MPPFQNEGQERNRFLGNGGQPLSSSSKVSRPLPFADEGDEGHRLSSSAKRLKSQAVAKPTKAFADEASEELSDRESGAEDFVPKGDVTSESFTKATGWSKHVKEVEASKKAAQRRTYNNSKRAAAAANNPNRRNTLVFATRGADPDRISKLQGGTCECALTAAVIGCVCHCCSALMIWSACSQTHVQAMKDSGVNRCKQIILF